MLPTPSPQLGAARPVRSCHVTTICGSRDELIGALAPFVEGNTLFVPGQIDLQAGDVVKLQLSLRDGTVALAGLFEARAVHRELAGRPPTAADRVGVLFVVRRLEESSQAIHQQVLRRRRELAGKATPREGAGAVKIPALAKTLHGLPPAEAPTPGPMSHTPVPTLISQPPKPGAVSAPDVNPFTEMSTNGIGFFVEATLFEEKDPAPGAELGMDATSISPPPDFLGLPVPNAAPIRSTQTWPAQPAPGPGSAPAPSRPAAPAPAVAQAPAPSRSGSRSPAPGAPTPAPAPTSAPAPATRSASASGLRPPTERVGAQAGPPPEPHRGGHGILSGSRIQSPTSLAMATTAIAPVTPPPATALTPAPASLPDARPAEAEFAPIPTMEVDLDADADEAIPTALTPIKTALNPLRLRCRALLTRLGALLAPLRRLGARAAPLGRLGNTGRWVWPLAAVAAVVIVGITVVNARRPGTGSAASIPLAAPSIVGSAVPGRPAPADDALAMAAVAPLAPSAPEPALAAAPEPRSQPERAPAPEPEPAPEPRSQPAAAPGTEPAGESTGGCSADIQSIPRAEVIVAGKSLGQTPLRAALVPCGDSDLSLHHPRYRRVNRTLHAVPDAPAQVSLRMQRPTARLHLASSPAGAVFKVNGDTIGRGPRTVEVPRFETVRVEAALPGQKPWRRKFYVKAAETKLQAAVSGGGRARKR